MLFKLTKATQPDNAASAPCHCAMLLCQWQPAMRAHQQGPSPGPQVPRRCIGPRSRSRRRRTGSALRLQPRRPGRRLPATWVGGESQAARAASASQRQAHRACSASGRGASGPEVRSRGVRSEERASSSGLQRSRPGALAPSFKLAPSPASSSWPRSARSSRVANVKRGL